MSAFVHRGCSFTRLSYRWLRFQIARNAAPRARSFRTTALLAIVCVLNLFDLLFTQAQIPRGNFAELNALAAQFVDCPISVATYKVLLFGLGAFILYRCRRHWESEAGVWVLTAAYTGLMFWWLTYLDVVEVCLGDPVVDVSQIAF